MSKTRESISAQESDLSKSQNHTQEGGFKGKDQKNIQTDQHLTNDKKISTEDPISHSQNPDQHPPNEDLEKDNQKQYNDEVEDQFQQSEMGSVILSEETKILLSPEELRKQSLGHEQYWQEKNSLLLFLKDLQLYQSHIFPYQTKYQPKKMSVFDQIDKEEEQYLQKDQDQLQLGKVQEQEEDFLSSQW